MKKHSKTLSKRMRLRIDFEYIKGLGEQEKRAAAFYEYACHSVPLREYVAELRLEGAFQPGAKLSQESLLKMTSRLNILRLEQLSGLVLNVGYPEKHYKDTNPGREFFTSDLNYYGIDVVTRIPWPAVMEGVWQRRTKDDQLEYLRQHNGSSTLQAIAIPWKYTNDELASLFRNILDKLRPDNFPEPSKAGRKGRSEKLAIGTMLKQLAAYRLDMAGFGHSTKGSPYGSRKGFNKAVKAAAKRIGQMMSQPFFS